MKFLLTAVLLAAGLSSAQAFEGSRATKGWGTIPGGAQTRATTHYTQGLIAGQVHAGKRLSPNNNTITAIGVQNVTSVNGDGNTLNTSQSGTNTGDVRNQGQISGGDGGDNVVSTN